jgi:hypothetical protein
MSDIQTIIHRHNDGQGSLTFERVQDCNAIAEKCKTQANQGVTGSSDMKLAASLPYVMVEAYMNRTGIDMNEFCKNKEHIRNMLNDPALAHFRIWGGKI